MSRINVRGVQATEVASTTGSEGLANEFAGIGELAGAFVQGAVGVATYAEGKRRGEAKAREEALTTEFQVSQLEAQVEQGQAELAATLTPEQLERLNAAKNRAQRLQVLESSAARKLDFQIARKQELIKAINADPANREEYVKIFRTTADYSSLEQQIDPLQESIQKAQAETIRTQLSLLNQHGYVSSAEMGMLSPAEVSNLYEQSGLARVIRKSEALDLERKVLESGQAVTEANLNLALDQYEQENPEVLPANILADSSNTLNALLDMADKTQTERAAFVEDAKVKLIASLSESTGLSPDKVSKRYSNYLTVYDDLKKFDPTGENVETQKNRISYLANQVFEGQIENDKVLLAAKALYDNIPGVMGDAGVQGQFAQPLLQSIQGVLSGDPSQSNFNAAAAARAGRRNPEKAGKLLNDLLTEVSDSSVPADVRNAAVLGTLDAINVNYGKQGSEILGRSVGAMAAEGMDKVWRDAVESTGQDYSAKITQASARYSALLDDSIETLTQNIGEEPEFDQDALLTGEVKVLNSNTSNTRELTRLINNTVRAIAHINGMNDYAKVIQEMQ